MMYVHPSCFVINYMEERNIGITEFSNRTSIPEIKLRDFVFNYGELDSDMAKKLAKFFHTSEQLWINLNDIYFNRGDNNENSLY